MARITENDIALAVMKIAAARPNLLCTLTRARNEIPQYVKLSVSDLAQSTTRPNEPMWHQLIRNIQSHHSTDGNFINSGLLLHVPRQGYRITETGLNYLKKNGL